MKIFRNSFAGFFFMAICLLISSCGIFENDDADIVAGVEDVYAGIYTQGIEDSNFNPCIDQDESWQLVEIEDTTFIAQLQEVNENPVYMELRGTPSEKGEFQGIFATFDRQFTVNEVVRVTSQAENECE